MHFLETLFFQWAPFMTIHELTRISRNKLVVVNISFSGGTATPTSTLRLETFNRDMSPNSRVTNLGRFHNSNLESYWKFEMKSVMDNESLWAIIYGHSLSNNDVDVRRCIKIEYQRFDQQHPSSTSLYPSWFWVK